MRRQLRTTSGAASTQQPLRTDLGDALASLSTLSYVKFILCDIYRMCSGS